MTDSYPEHFVIEIDRERLRGYLRAKYLLCWLLFLGFFGGLFGFASASAELERGIESWEAAVLLTAKSVAIGVGVSSLIALLLYLLLSPY
jgi:hypothetical protein